MAEANSTMLAFNRGIVSPLALGRVDIKRLAMSATQQQNWWPRALGPMSLRPGTQYLANTYQNHTAKYIPFVFSVTDTALIELTDSVMRVLVNDALVTRVAVGTQTTNGNFTGNITGWTDASDPGGASAWAAGNYLQLTGDGTDAGAVTQTVVVAGGDVGKAHGLRIVVNRGNVELRVGSAAGLDDYVGDTILYAGTHSIELTPTGNIYIQLGSRVPYPILVQSVTIEAAGVMTLPTPWVAANLGNIRVDTSADVIFCACYGVRQQEIQRRGVHSWSVADFVCDDGPFLNQNVTPTTIAPSALIGLITLTASKPVFKAGHVGALFRLTSIGQNVSLVISSQNTWTNPIEVTGLTAHRGFNITITGVTGTGSKVTMQQSFGAPGAWVNVPDGGNGNWSSGVTTDKAAVVFNDGLDNQIIYYRLGIATGNYVAGNITCALSYPAGSTNGIARVIGFTDNMHVTALVVQPMGATTATALWYEGAWSAVQGYPSVPRLYQDRLWFSGSGQFWGSITDQYTSNDDTVIGDSGPISRTIGSGPLDVINWMEPMLYALSVGAQTQELSIRSDVLGNPITPTSFNIQPGTNDGSAPLPCVKIDYNLIYVGRSGSRVFSQTANEFSGRLTATDISILTPEVCQPQVTRVALSRNIDNRIFFVRSDGTLVVLVFEETENVKCFVTGVTNGTFEDVVVLPAAPGSVEDNIYFVVARTVNGSTVRFLEKLALQSDCLGATLNKQADAYTIYSGAPTNTISGLSYLQGMSVVCWADGVSQGTFVVDNTGTITLPVGVTVSNAVVGLGYQAVFESAKLSEQPIELTQKKRIDHIGVVLDHTHYQGLQYGTDLTHLDDLPLMEAEQATAANTVWPSYDNVSFELNGTYDTDTRLYLVANAPLPCTLVALKIDLAVNAKG